MSSASDIPGYDELIQHLIDNPAPLAKPLMDIIWEIRFWESIME